MWVYLNISHITQELVDIYEVRNWDLYNVIFVKTAIIVPYFILISIIILRVDIQ